MKRVKGNKVLKQKKNIVMDINNMNGTHPQKV